MPALPPNTIELLVDIDQRRASTGDLASWAIDALEGGFDTRSIRKLAASLHHEPLSETLPYLWRTLGELGIEPPHGEALLRSYAAVIAEHVVAGTLLASDAVQRMHSRVVTPLNHPPDLMPWCYLWEGNDPHDVGADLADRSEADVAALVRAEALSLLGR